MNDNTSKPLGVKDGDPQGPLAPAAITPRYRYIDAISKIRGCPHNANATFGKACFRAVNVPRHINDFRPHAARVPPTMGHDCRGWAMSLYDSLTKLREMIARQQLTAPQIQKRYGTHFVELELSTAHGVRTASSQHEHFAFFEYDTFDPETCVKNIGTLFP
jgi:hypothetical protein